MNESIILKSSLLFWCVAILLLPGAPKIHCQGSQSGTLIGGIASELTNKRITYNAADAAWQEKSREIGLDSLKKVSKDEAIKNLNEAKQAARQLRTASNAYYDQLQIDLDQLKQSTNALSTPADLAANGRESQLRSQVAELIREREQLKLQLNSTILTPERRQTIIAQANTTDDLASVLQKNADIIHQQVDTGGKVQESSRDLAQSIDKIAVRMKSARKLGDDLATVREREVDSLLSRWMTPSTAEIRSSPLVGVYTYKGLLPGRKDNIDCSMKLGQGGPGALQCADIIKNSRYLLSLRIDTLMSAENGENVGEWSTDGLGSSYKGMLKIVNCTGGVGISWYASETNQFKFPFPRDKDKIPCLVKQ
jgi:predicted  nucleic acid-binding Zn-ribbon protein